MEQIITEKDCPIQGLWVLKSVAPHIIILLFLGFGAPLFFWLSDRVGGGNPNAAQTTTPLVIIAIIVMSAIVAAPFILGMVIPILRRKTFHFAFGNSFLTLQQGIFAKQQRNIPYGAIQNIYIRQDVYDRMLNLATLAFEDASRGGGLTGDTKQIGRIRPFIQGEMVGFSSSKVNIPGLTKQKAETLKDNLLEKIKGQPFVSRQSGL